VRLEARAREPLPFDFGLYRVVGRRNYRDHKPGEEFEARLDRQAERRALTRGDIELLGRITPELQPGSYRFPHGWLAQPFTSTPESAERRSSY
jgi:hypothetical protein